MKTVPVAALRRIAALLFAVLLLIPLFSPLGTREIGTETEEASVPALQSGSPESELITESDVYQYLLGEILKCKTEISVSEYNLNEEQIGEVFAMLFYSEAELFFIDGHYSFTRYAGSGIIQTIRPLYPDNVDEIPAMLAEFHEMTDAIIAEVDPTMSDWEKVAFIHDYIALHFVYDRRALDDATKDQAIYDAYGMVKSGIGVCQAYSLLTRYLLKKLGIECECVSCKGLNHEWNIVKIGNSWYHMDVTWDDRDDKGFYGQVSHDYFLASDSFFDAGVGEDRNHHSETGWVSPVRATSGRYDGAFVDVTTPFVFTPDAIYAINDGALVTYDPEADTFTELFDLGLQWHAFGGVWQGTYAGLWYLNGKLYWNGENSVYSYAPGSGATAGTRVDRYVDLSGTAFGMRATADDRTVTFTFAIMRDPNSGEVTEKVRSKGGYVITWVIGGTSYETVCLKGETPHFDGATELPSNLFDYTFLSWDKTIRQASADATYTAQFRMDRNDVTLEGKTMREQYRLIRAAILLLPYANAGYAEASARAAELDAIASDYASRVSAANATFSGVLFGDE